MIKLTKVIAGYLPSEDGPFECGHCVYFNSGRCEIVEGKIDEDGCCNLFTRDKGKKDTDDETSETIDIPDTGSDEYDS